MNELQMIDQREILGKTFRIFGTIENPLFVAQDVADWIEHSNSRSMLDGVDENEIANQSAVYITTAGYKGTFSYDKLIQTLCQSVARPDAAIVLGGTYRTPMMERLLSKNFISDLKMDGTFNEASFDREYNSIWAGSVEGAFFDPERFDKCRDIQLAENEASKRTSDKGYYLLGVDVGRVGLIFVGSSKISLIAGTSLLIM